VYAGGVLGSSNGATVVSSTSSGAINSIGFGYNTSAGGIGGYIVASRVLDSSASGSVSATASSRTFGWDDSWQVYSGGLIGYAGGSDTAPSSIEHSNATSTVNATSPFPYAGGLVGYLYGYNDFSNPAKNGSTVTRSFATGDVTAISSTDPSGTYGDIPYAGGLVGYSSVVGCRIENSYARGNATVTTNGTYAWAGGLIGGNANDAVVSKTYATGTVSSTTGTLPPLYAPDYADAGPAAGGIAGFNYYSTATTVSDSAALNNRVNGNQTSQNVVHRVAGSTGNTSGRIGTLNNNIGSQSMAIGTNWQQDIGSNLRDGADTAAQPGEPVFTGTLRWDFLNIWVMASDNYPALR
jgi:hypothetical protein